MIGNFNSIQTRVKDAALLNDTGRLEVEQLCRLQDYFAEQYLPQKNLRRENVMRAAEGISA